VSVGRNEIGREPNRPRAHQQQIGGNKRERRGSREQYNNDAGCVLKKAEHAGVRTDITLAWTTEDATCHTRSTTSSSATSSVVIKTSCTTKHEAAVLTASVAFAVMSRIAENETTAPEIINLMHSFDSNCAEDYVQTNVQFSTVLPVQYSVL
jgi:hypothetical protein